MRAVIVKKPGGVEQLAVSDVPAPRPRRGELLVRVQAAEAHARMEADHNIGRIVLTIE
jgi:hypothetical protein